MSNIHYIVLIVALWSIYLIFISLIDVSGFKKGIKKKETTWKMFNDETTKKYNLERGLKAWKGLGISNEQTDEEVQRLKQPVRASTDHDKARKRGKFGGRDKRWEKQ